MVHNKVDPKVCRIGEISKISTKNEISVIFYFFPMLRTTVVLAGFCILSLVCSSPVNPIECVYHVGEDIYNLTPLWYYPAFLSPPGYSIEDVSGNIYYLNFCDEVSTSLDGCNPGNTESAVCQESGDVFYPAGQVANTTVVNFIRK